MAQQSSCNIYVILNVFSIQEIMCYKETVILKINIIHPSSLDNHLDTETSSSDVFSGFCDRLIWNSGFWVLSISIEHTVDFCLLVFSAGLEYFVIQTPQIICSQLPLKYGKKSVASIYF